jgi:hypothetical protein
MGQVADREGRQDTMGHNRSFGIKAEGVEKTHGMQQIQLHRSLKQCLTSIALTLHSFLLLM